LVGSKTLFVTGVGEGGEERSSIGLEIGSRADEVDVRFGRMSAGDVRFDGDGVRKYYLCTGTGMRRVLMDWLSDKELVFEDFNF
jgi:hypothetical protein